MLAPMGVGFPCLIGYRCLAMPSDKHSGFSLHLFCAYNQIIYSNLYIMKYTKSEIRKMSWHEWNETMAKELNEAGFKAKGFNKETGKWEKDYEPYKAYAEDPETFILGVVSGAKEINYLKSIGLLSNGRCPMCGKNIEVPGRFTSGYDPNCHFQICQSCVNKEQGVSINPSNNTGCMLSLLFIPWYLVKAII